MSAPALMAARSIMCTACGMFAAVQRELTGWRGRAITDLCQICLDNEAYARSDT